MKVSRMVPFLGSMVQWRSQLLGSAFDGTSRATVVMVVILEVGWLVLTEFGWLVVLAVGRLVWPEFGWFAAWVLLAAGGVTTGGAPVAVPWLLAVTSGFSGGDVVSGVDDVLIAYHLERGWPPSGAERKNQHKALDAVLISHYD